MSSQNRKILLFVDHCAAYMQDVYYVKDVTVVSTPPPTPSGNSIFQSLNLGTQR